MIVYVGDWVKVMGAWRQVVDVDPISDTFSTISTVDGERMAWGTKVSEVFQGHMSDISFQQKLEECGL